MNLLTIKTTKMLLRNKSFITNTKKKGKTFINYLSLKHEFKSFTILTLQKAFKLL